jgi:hypothetical protein
MAAITSASKAARKTIEPGSNQELFNLLGISEYSEKTQVYADLSKIKKDEIPKNKISRALLNLSGSESSYEKLSAGDKKSLIDFYTKQKPDEKNPTKENLEKFAREELNKVNSQYNIKKVSNFLIDRPAHQQKVYAAVGVALKEIDVYRETPSTAPKPNSANTLRQELAKRGIISGSGQRT